MNQSHFVPGDVIISDHFFAVALVVSADREGYTYLKFMSNVEPGMLITYDSEAVHSLYRPLEGQKKRRRRRNSDETRP